MLSESKIGNQEGRDMKRLPGVFQARKKNGDIYFRSSVTFRGKHISLGSFATQEEAHRT